MLKGTGSGHSFPWLFTEYLFKVLYSLVQAISIPSKTTVHEIVEQHWLSSLDQLTLNFNVSLNIKNIKASALPYLMVYSILLALNEDGASFSMKISKAQAP